MSLRPLLRINTINLKNGCTLLFYYIITTTISNAPEVEIDAVVLGQMVVVGGEVEIDAVVLGRIVVVGGDSKEN